ncbi:two-component sensor histidine kinase [Acrocarpospora phusangensis]|uniref:histidine kinase n=2 Tax=Acrocarpospora phusangensis TaxID=1070424 RepID=A0A919UUL6_9ACTN|nr:two-component sensor histidine kinase [Acrocarpospora phusangensis]
MAAALLGMLFAILLAGLFHRLAGAQLTDAVNGTATRLGVSVQRDLVPVRLAHGYIPNVQIADSAGRVVAASAPMAGKGPMSSLLPPPGTPGDAPGASAVVCDSTPLGNKCHIVVEQRVYSGGQSWTVYAAAPTPPLVDPGLAAVLIAGVLALTGAVTYTCRHIVGESLNPVDAIRSELDEINATDPARRVSIPPHEDEIHRLADSINHTLGRLQEALEQQRQFTSDVCHDLRGPVAAMRLEVEDAMTCEAPTVDSDMGETMLANLERLQAIIRDLLVIACLDGGTPGTCDTIDLAELVTAELDARHASAKRIERELSPGVAVRGDRLRLGRLLGNLVDNAERHADSRVTVRVSRLDGGPAAGACFATGTAVLEVLDDGAGIPRDQWDKVFQRFVRLSESRERDPGGTGLGLAIARQIAEMSGGTLCIADCGRGARFVLQLPMAPAA